MTITFGLSHEYQAEELSYDTETKKFSVYWLKLMHFDRRRSYITIYNFDPYTGEKINIKQLKKYLV
jgi:hypothetical protein